MVAAVEHAPSAAAYRFYGFTLDLVRGALLAADGAEVALRPKAFALLRRFVESAGRLIDKDEIMAAVWPGVIVTDDSVTQVVKEIRRALGDDAQRLLRTVPRRGFLFAAEVSPVGDGAAPPAAVLPAAVLPAAVLPAAVLPAAVLPASGVAREGPLGTTFSPPTPAAP